MRRLVDGETGLSRAAVGSSTAWRRLRLMTGLSRAPRRPAGARGTDVSEEQRRLQHRARRGRGSRRNARCTDFRPSSRARKRCSRSCAMPNARRQRFKVLKTLQCYLVLNIFAPFALISSVANRCRDVYELCFDT